MALEAGKPVVVNETTARDSMITDDPELAATYWDEWFSPYFEWMEANEQIKAFYYINADWTGLGHYGDAGWGQADITVNTALTQRFIDEISAEKFLHLAEIDKLKGF
jgi:hypothetical protein